jgi:preprotein translocase SecE subunit
MSDEKKNLSVNSNEESEAVSEKKSNDKLVAKKPNIFARAWKRICKFTRDVVGEMRKVSWTPKDELKKSTKLVVAAVIAVALAIAVVDTCCAWVINSVAGLIG